MKPVYTRLETMILSCFAIAARIAGTASLNRPTDRRYSPRYENPFQSPEHSKPISKFSANVFLELFSTPPRHSCISRRYGTLVFSPRHDLPCSFLERQRTTVHADGLVAPCAGPFVLGSDAHWLGN